MRTQSPREKQDYDKNMDNLLDALNRRNDQLVLCEAELAPAKRQLETAAMTLTRILAAIEGKTLIKTDDVRRAIFGDPLKMDGTFGG